MSSTDVSHLILWVYQRHSDFTKRTPRVMCLQYQITFTVLLHDCTCCPDLKTNITANLSKSYTSKADTPPSCSECVYRKHLTSTQYTRGRDLEDDISCVRLTLPQYPAAQCLILELHVNTCKPTSIKSVKTVRKHCTFSELFLSLMNFPSRSISSMDTCPLEEECWENL